jgi:low affinity Fe/Cu permease
MKRIYLQLERYFEKLTLLATILLGNSITFIGAVCLVIFWLSHKQFYLRSAHEKIGDIILSITFLSLFIIQKSFNRFSGSLHLKVNELVASHEPASNTLINVEEKTEREITELSKEYIELALLAKTEKKPLTNKATNLYSAINKKVKKLLTILAIFIITTEMQAQKLSLRNIPSSVKVSFKRAYPLATDVNWAKQEANYSAEFEVAKVSKCATYDAFGMIVESWEKLPKADLPIIASEFIDKNYQEYSINRVRKITNAMNMVEYEVKLDNRLVLFDSLGNFRITKKD